MQPTYIRTTKKAARCRLMLCSIQCHRPGGRPGGRPQGPRRGGPPTIRANRNSHPRHPITLPPSVGFLHDSTSGDGGGMLGADRDLFQPQPEPVHGGDGVSGVAVLAVALVVIVLDGIKVPAQGGRLVGGGQPAGLAGVGGFVVHPHRSDGACIPRHAVFPVRGVAPPDGGEPARILGPDLVPAAAVQVDGQAPDGMAGHSGVVGEVGHCREPAVFGGPGGVADGQRVGPGREVGEGVPGPWGAVGVGEGMQTAGGGGWADGGGQTAGGGGWAGRAIGVGKGIQTAVGIGWVAGISGIGRGGQTAGGVRCVIRRPQHAVPGEVVVPVDVGFNAGLIPGGAVDAAVLGLGEFAQEAVPQVQGHVVRHVEEDIAADQVHIRRQHRKTDGGKGLGHAAGVALVAAVVHRVARLLEGVNDGRGAVKIAVLPPPVDLAVAVGVVVAEGFE